MSATPAPEPALTDLSRIERLFSTMRLTVGIISILLGVAVLVWPRATLLVVAVLFGVQLILTGAVRIGAALTLPGLEGWLRAVDVILGALVVLAGLFCLRNPAASLLGLLLLISLGWLIHGISDLVAASAAPSGRRWLFVLGGVLSIVGAVLILFWPGLALVTFTVLGGWLLIVFGVSAVVTAVRSRRRVASERPQPGGEPAPA
jgi:uncharacterized membrane protein HdeD (DUF308 family)